MADSRLESARRRYAYAIGDSRKVYRAMALLSPILLHCSSTVETCGVDLRSSGRAERQSRYRKMMKWRKSSEEKIIGILSFVEVSILNNGLIIQHPHLGDLENQSLSIDYPVICGI